MEVQEQYKQYKKRQNLAVITFPLMTIVDNTNLAWLYRSTTPDYVILAEMLFTIVHFCEVCDCRKRSYCALRFYG